MRTVLIVVLVVIGIPMSFFGWVVLPRWARERGQRRAR